MTTFTHLDVTYTGGRITLAIKEDVEAQKVIVAAAFCSPKDQFCRRTGRELALAAMNSPKSSFRFPLNGPRPLRQIKDEAIAKALLKVSEPTAEFAVPRWAVGGQFSFSRGAVEKSYRPSRTEDGSVCVSTTICTTIR
jgi:hypothetical protein